MTAARSRVGGRAGNHASHAEREHGSRRRTVDGVKAGSCPPSARVQPLMRDRARGPLRWCRLMAAPTDWMTISAETGSLRSDPRI